MNGSPNNSMNTLLKILYPITIFVIVVDVFFWNDMEFFFAFFVMITLMILILSILSIEVILWKKKKK